MSSLDREIKKCENKISSARRQKEALNEQMEALDAEISRYEIHLEAIHSTLKLLGIETQNTPKYPVKQPELRQGSEIARVRDMIRDAGEPLHITVITEKLGTPGREKRVSLGGSLNSYVKAHRIFTKPAPSTYGLMEFLNKRESEGNKENDEIN